MKVYYKLPCSNMRAPYVNNTYESFYIGTCKGDFDAIFCANCNCGVAAGICTANTYIDELNHRATVEPVAFQWRFCPYCGVEFDYPQEMFLPTVCVSEPAKGVRKSVGGSRSATCGK